KVSTRLGPVTMTFSGTARFKERDESNHRALIKAGGSDTKGRGAVDADITLTLEADGNATKVLVHTDLRLSGSVAQYGRGQGMITDLATHWMDEFAKCLRARLPAKETGTDPEPAPGTGPDPASDRPASSEPMPLLGVSVRIFWRALVRAVGRLFGRS
ncbi:MAG: hypothetical protein R3174_05035, partial [Gammaproteobacteria bacterium]|nr:hypothetical protein [Gammaproteobacteria bacterium]